MERDHPATNFESDDDANKEEKSTKKKQRRIPLPIEKQVHEQLAPLLAEQEKAAELKHEKKKKRKKRKKKPAEGQQKAESKDTTASEEVEAEGAEQEAPAEKKPRRKKSKETGQAEESSEDELSHEVEIEPIEEFLGELPVSDRAIREFEERRLREQAEIPDEEPQAIPEIKEQEAEKPKEDWVSKLKKTVGPRETPEVTAPKGVGKKAENPDARDIGRTELADPSLSPFVAANESLATPTMRNELAASERGPERSSVRRNLIVGLLLGGVIEHIRHRKSEKKLAKAHAKEFSTLRSEQKDERVRHEEKERVSERRMTALERQLVRLKAQAKEAIPTPSLPVSEKRPSSSAAPRPERPVVQKQAEAETRPASYDTQETPEVRAAREKLEQALRAEAAQEVEEQQAELPKDRRVEQSAWHRIEVDKKTGRTVENPTLAYGEEFKHEQHQEHLHQPKDSEAQGEGAAQPGAFPMPQSAQQPASQSQQQLQQQQKALNRPSRPDSDNQIFGVNAGALTDIVLWTILIIIVFSIIAILRA